MINYTKKMYSLCWKTGLNRSFTQWIAV